MKLMYHSTTLPRVNAIVEPHDRTAVVKKKNLAYKLIIESPNRKGQLAVHMTPMQLICIFEMLYSVVLQEKLCIPHSEQPLTPYRPTSSPSTSTQHAA
jgi:hypothetical protein